MRLGILLNDCNWKCERSIDSCGKPSKYFPLGLKADTTIYSLSAQLVPGWGCNKHSYIQDLVNELNGRPLLALKRLVHNQFRCWLVG